MISLPPRPEPPSPPSFWATVRLLLTVARRRTRGRRARTQQLLNQKSGKSYSSDWSYLGTLFALALVVGINIASAFLVDSSVGTGQRLDLQRSGKIVVSDDFLAEAKGLGAAGCSSASAFHSEARRISEKYGGTVAANEQMLINARVGNLVSSESAASGIELLPISGRLPAMLGSLILFVWVLMLVFQGEGLELDLQCRRHPMWEWIFSHPVPAGAVFLAEMLGPLAANPIYWAAPAFAGFLYGFVYGPLLGLLATFLVGVPLSFACACTGKALEIGTVLRFPPRTRGAIVGLMGWLGYASMMLMFLGLFILPKVITALGRILSLFTVIPWPWLRLFLGGTLQGGWSFTTGVLTCGAASVLILAAAVWFSAWAADRGLSGNFAALAPTGSRPAKAARFGSEPLYRKEFLWFIRDRSAIVQTILIPLTVAGVQLFNLRGLIAEAQSAWNYLAGSAILFGTYFLWVLGPKSLASEGAALWISLTWPRGLEDLLKAKAWLWSLVSTGIVSLALCYGLILFPQEFWKIVLVGIAWFFFSRSMAEKSVTLVTIASESGDVQPVPKGRRHCSMPESAAMLWTIHSLSIPMSAMTPIQDPNSLISDLIIAGTRAIVIVDNCRPAVHRKLSATVADRASKVSLVTIEYDVRDDEFEDTDVFELNAASESLVERLLAQRFPALSHSDIHTIAKMAGGNLRIAIVIASSGGRSGSFASLKSDELMDRLFYQKNEVDPDLRRAGHILSLPYSFSVENPELENSELAFLAELAETSVSRLYEHARILRDRDLIQQRGMFRALLPPGISNRLAQVGLERIPAERARDWLARIPFRFLKSVAHRLSFLDGMPEAEQIADEWLSPGGLVGSPDQLTEDLQQIFLYIAPLRPALASECLERAFMNMDDAQTARLCAPYIDFLQWLAHDATLFGPCVNLLVRVRAGTERKPGSKLVHDQFFHLFQAYLSGTHATVEQRIAILESLLLQPIRSARFAIGIAGLKSLLKSRDFTGNDWRFGTSSRDYGLWPQGEGFRHWFRMTLAFCERLDRRGSELGIQVRAAVAEELRDLWLCEAVYPELQSLAKSFSKRRFWPEGWIAAKSIGKWREDELTKSSQAALPQLVSALRPNTLEDRALTFAQRKMQTLYFEMQDYEEDYTAVERRVSDEGVKLGGELASDLETLRTVMPALLNREMFVPVHSLAAGLAGKLRNPASVWALLQRSYCELSEDERKPEFLAVFLSSLQKKRATFVETALEKLSHNPEFAPDFPSIQCAVIPGSKGVARLIESMKSDTVASSSYQAIANISDCLTDKEFGKLFRPLAKRPGGFDACLHLIWLRLARMKNQPSKPTTGLKTLGRDLLLQWDCDPHGSMMDYRLAEVVEKCMPSLGSEKVAYELCARCSKKAHMSLFFLDQYPRLFTAMMKVYPEDTLSGLLDSGSKLQRRGSARRRNHESGSLFAALPEKTVIDWCEKGKPGRYVLLASVIDAISEGDKGDTAWQPLALAILAKARSKEKVLAAYFHQFRPMSWSGSRASIMERRLGLFDDLLLMPKLNRYYPYIQNEKANFLIDIERDRVLDKRLHGSGAATFE